MIDDENVVSVILQDSSNLESGESYRFCLVLVQERNTKSNLVVGCSNITKLETDLRQSVDSINNSSGDDHFTDISNFDKISGRTSNDYNPLKKLNATSTETTTKRINNNNGGGSTTFEIFNNNLTMNKSFLPGIGLGIIITSLFILLCAATKFKNDRPVRPPITTCYTASNVNGINPIDIETRNRYVKLQATTSL